MFGEILKRLRKEKHMTQSELGKAISVSKVSISKYENGAQFPDTDTLQKIADVFSVSTDYLLGRTDNKNYWALNSVDEKDVKKTLDDLLNNLDSNNAMAFNGEPLDDETRELLAISIERSLRFAKEEAKKKYTPKKYRD
ncbi:helix-turn-helix domain-containing protein [Listeria fleischmannii]|uniref:HTH cro/C1-type domain-containing protein n=1 Tax=Listeria fleischmannii FSL S10-1203 TaxID=1265822 RepID=W7DGG6_9LIST|nr:helix-turn-helix transcriptional regulator [Listeria fleischmannii]EUJ59493.1 hypothetical protein MCOL2_05825 [Listeria fleischmannii FSL S10-1203]